ncbi:MAG: L-alanine-DL-glutamate epimerase-like enolase superfamily enzyme [Chitinophagales bacterium]
MKITNFKTTLVNIPLANPISTAIHQMKSVGCVLLELETDEGLTGESYVFTLNGVRLKALHEMLLSFSHQVEGRDPHYITQIWQDIWDECNPIGHKGFSVAAMSAIDTACWDIVGKAANQPLHKIFGACRDSVKTYASGGLWLSQSIDECVVEAQSFIDAGFKSMKIRLGSPNMTDDVHRVAAVREAIGADIELLADANQALVPKKAIKLGRLLEPYQLGWFEEPVIYNDLKGSAEVRRALDAPIAGGETEYTRYGMTDILEAGAVDVLMPDLQRIGGLSEMRRVAAIASVHNVPISTHIFTEHSICIAASEPNCLSVEHMPWFSPLFNETMEIKDGNILVPDRPGIGFSFDQTAIARFKIS